VSAAVSASGPPVCGVLTVCSTYSVGGGVGSVFSYVDV